MPQNFYDLSETVFSWLEGAFESFWSALTGGALDFILQNWLKIFLFACLAAFVIDQALYYAKMGKEAPLVRFFIWLYRLCEKAVYKIAGKPLPEKASAREDVPTQALTRAVEKREPATIAPTVAFAPAGAEPVTQAKEPPIPEQSVRAAREDEVQPVVIAPDFTSDEATGEEPVTAPQGIVVDRLEDVPWDEMQAAIVQQLSAMTPAPEAPIDLPDAASVSEPLSLREASVALPDEPVRFPPEPIIEAPLYHAPDEYEEEPPTVERPE